MRERINRNLLLTAVLCICLAAVLFGCGKGKAAVRINEAMSSNNATLADDSGNYADWIELYNPTKKDVDLTGWALTDDADNPEKFVFPGGTLQANGYLVVFADKTKRSDPDAGVYHVPFGLSGKKGEDVLLFDDSGKLVSNLTLPPLDSDVSYGIDDKGKATVFAEATPGAENAGQKRTLEEAQPAAVEAGETTGTIVINEYATNDTQTLTDRNGDFVGWVELYNKGDAAVDLRGYTLTDDASDKARWVFPAATIDAGGYLLILLNDGKQSGDDLCAAFKLSGKEEQLLLCDAQHRTVDSCEVFDLFSNLSCGRTTDGGDTFGFFAAATPGKANKGQAFSSVDSAAKTGSKALVITEVAAVNQSKPAPDGVCYDYVELYNATEKPLDLHKYQLSDSKKAESFFRLPEQTLAPHSYTVVYCTDSKSTGGIALDLGLNRYGETVYLKTADGVFTDSLQYTRLSDGYSCGKTLDGDGTPVYYAAMTPGAANSENTLTQALANPVFSQSSTYVKKGTQIEIDSADKVCYTTDGSVPTLNSTEYTAPLTISKTTVVRARAFRKGAVPSDVITATYLVEKKHTLPVVFLSTDNANLYDPANGIWATGYGASSEFPYLGANYWKDWERPVHFEYMTTDGVSQVAFDAGMKVFGQFSRALEQKSVSIRLRDRYGPKEICCPFFEDNGVNVFSSLVLRNSGQDFNNAHLRDAFCAMVIKNQIDMEFMDYQPTAVYVNGKYHGIYDLREKIDADFLINHRGIDEDKTDLIKGSRNVQLGTIDSYAALIDYIKTHDPANAEVYNYLKTQIDIDNLICYWMCESFFNNTDTGNIRFYRENTKNGKWRWIFFDVDWALFPTTYQRNGIAAYLDPQGHGVGKAFSTTIMVRLMRNPDFRKRVLTLHKKHLTTTFDTKRMLQIFDGMVDQIDAEMRRHTARWSSLSYDNWKKNVATLRGIVEKMNPLFVEKMKTGFQMTAAEQAAYLP